MTSGADDPSRILGDVGFVHLHVHSSYSLREGAMPVAKLARLALADAMPALAITDSNNLFGALEFSEKLAKEGVQPVLGLQITIDFLRRRGKGAARRGERLPRIHRALGTGRRRLFEPDAYCLARLARSRTGRSRRMSAFSVSKGERKG